MRAWIWLIVLLLQLNEILSQKLCKHGDNHPCRCDLQDGGGVIDLRALGAQNGGATFPNVIDSQSASFVYSYNPCYAFSSASYVGLAALQTDQHHKEYSIGTQSSALFGLRDDHVTITYKEDCSNHSRPSPRTTIVTLICDTKYSQSGLRMDGEYPSGTYNFELIGPDVCPKRTFIRSHPIGFVIILLFASYFFYLFIGSTYNYFFNFKHGIQVIPNIKFWQTCWKKIKCWGNEENYRYDGM